MKAHVCASFHTGEETQWPPPTPPSAALLDGNDRGAYWHKGKIQTQQRAFAENNYMQVGYMNIESRVYDILWILIKEIILRAASV